MTPRVAINTLSEANTLERARLNLKFKTKRSEHLRAPPSPTAARPGRGAGPVTGR